MNKICFLICFFFSCKLISQTTLIPDVGFEEELIFQNIDSDGVVNGEILTSDISSVSSLIIVGVSSSFIEDITGIEDFQNIQYLDITNTSINTGNLDGSLSKLDLTDNHNLQEFIMLGQDDAISNSVFEIDLSNNPLINNIDVPGNWNLRILDLKTNSIDVSNLIINISVNPSFAPPNDLFCIKVTDPSSASAGTGVYNTWNISANNNPYYFSDTCTLDAEEFIKFSFTIYPNPVKDVLYIDATTSIEKVIIYDHLGKVVFQKKSNINDQIDLKGLSEGIYYVKIESNNRVMTKKLIKN
jgi:hypothetical protein